jgi:hypothetical protein
VAHTPDPKRVAAGRLNWSKRKVFTPDGLERLRQAALENRPWRFSTGPRTAEGKARAAGNGKRCQKGPLSVAAIKAELASYRALLEQMQECRVLARGPTDVDQ